MATKRGEKKEVPAEKIEAPEGKAAKPAKEKKPKGIRSKFPANHIITLLVAYNPKRKGSASHTRFENYEDEMTVEGALKAGLTAGDLAWDVAHGHIEIGESFNEDAVKKEAPAPKPKKEKAPKAPKSEKAAKPKAKAKAPVEDEDEDEDEE